MHDQKSMYYGVKKEKNYPGWRGRVYHYDETGNKEVEDYQGPLRSVKNLAIDDAAEWLEEQSKDAYPDDTWSGDLS